MEIPKLVNLQTRDEYEEAFRYMWNWIADKTIERKEKVTKYEFFDEHGFGWPLNNVPLNFCYMCEYTKYYAIEHGIIPKCKKCPVKWSTTSNDECNANECVKIGAEYDLWDNAIDWKSASVYARAIANIPVVPLKKRKKAKKQIGDGENGDS